MLLYNHVCMWRAFGLIVKYLGVGMDACKAPHGKKSKRKNSETIDVDAFNMLSLNQTSQWIKELPHHYEKDIGGVIERHVQQP